jgi:protease-4
VRRHPVIFGIFLLLLIITVFFLLVYVLGSSTEDGRSFTLDNKIGVVKVEGFIGDTRDVVDQLNQFGKDDAVKAVVLRIDSPGGGVASSQEIYAAVTDLKKKKKVITSMGSVAASGGYMVACATDKIVANPGTMTGSISAVMHFANAQELLKKLGLKASAVKSGKFKDIGSPVREMTAEERALMQGLVDDIYDQFLDMVARDRNIPKEKLRKIADGRIFTGRQAQKLGLVDDLGDMGYAVALAGEMSGIKGKPEVVYPKKKGSKFWDYMFREMFIALEHEMLGKAQQFNGVLYLSPLANQY